MVEGLGVWVTVFAMLLESVSAVSSCIATLNSAEEGIIVDWNGADRRYHPLICFKELSAIQ